MAKLDSSDTGQLTFGEECCDTLDHQRPRLENLTFMISILCAQMFGLWKPKASVPAPTTLAEQFTCPPALTVPPFCITAQFSSFGGNGVRFEPGRAPFAIPKQGEDSELGSVEVSPQMVWIRAKAPPEPLERLSVLSKNGHALDGHDAEFQLDPQAQTTIVPSGLIDPPGRFEYFPGEAFGWCNVSLDGALPARTWANLLKGFQMSSPRLVVGETVYEGRNSTGWTVQIRTDTSGDRLHLLEIRHLQKPRASRCLTFTKWKSLGGRTVPVEGQVSVLEVPGMLGSFRTRFTYAALQRVGSLPPVPWQNGMLFQWAAPPPSEPGASFRLEDGKLVRIASAG